MKMKTYVMFSDQTPEPIGFQAVDDACAIECALAYSLEHGATVQTFGLGDMLMETKPITGQEELPLTLPSGKPN